VVAVVGGERRQAEVAITGREGMTGLLLRLAPTGHPSEAPATDLRGPGVFGVDRLA
jgi:hypothetical protein